VKDIAPILRHLQATRDKFLEAIDSFPDDRWRESPRAGVWSAAEVVAHVTTVERAINKNAHRVLGAPPVTVSFLKRFHIPLRAASYRFRRVKSPVPLKPELIRDKQAQLESLAAVRKITTDFLESTRDRDLSGYRAPHPYFGSLNLYQWHHFIAFHEERHRKQLREIVDSFQL